MTRVEKLHWWLANLPAVRVPQAGGALREGGARLRALVGAASEDQATHSARTQQRLVTRGYALQATVDVVRFGYNIKI